MVTTRPKGKYTYDDYAAKPDDERWELVDGVLYQMAPAPSVKHQIATKNLGRLIDARVVVRNSGLLLYAPTDVILSDQTTVQPDILYVSAERFHIITERACEGPPDLVVEVLSPSNAARDLEIKRELYARYGVPQYLIVDADAETVRALAQPMIDGNVGLYVNEAVFYPGDTVRLAMIPGLRITVSDIFASPL